MFAKTKKKIIEQILMITAEDLFDDSQGMNLKLTSICNLSLGNFKFTPRS